MKRTHFLSMPGSESRAIERRVCELVSLALAVAALLYLIEAVVLDYRSILKVTAGGSIAMYALIYTGSRRDRRGSWLRLLFLIYSFLVAVGLWFTLGGFYSDAPLLLVGFYVVALFLFSSRRARIGVTLTFALILTTLLVMQFVTAVQFARDPSRLDVTRGIAITTVIVAASLFLVVEAFKTSHQNDRRMLSVLLAELNHRVKNNLSIVSSLVTLKDAELADQADLSDLNNQVKAVMKVHETLQESENVSRLPLRPFVDDLLSSVFAHHKDQGIRIRNDVDDVEMDSKRAVVLGLIVTELATNARKYAFDRTENAELRVELKHDAPHSSYVLTVSNNGAPIPEGVCLDNADSLGLQLVSHLVTQLSGSIRMQRAPTPRFVIRFPID